MEVRFVRSCLPSLTRSAVLAALTGCAALVAGCAAGEPATAVMRRSPQCGVATRTCRPSATPPANLVLGPSEAHLQLAQTIGRAERPAAVIGYTFDDVTEFTHIVIDDQSYFDELGGYHINIGEHARRGVTIRP